MKDKKPLPVWRQYLQFGLLLLAGGLALLSVADATAGDDGNGNPCSQGLSFPDEAGYEDCVSGLGDAGLE